MATEKFQIATQLLSYNRTKDNKEIPYVTVNGLICRTQSKLKADSDGNVIGTIEVQLVKKGEMQSDGQPAKNDSYTLVDFQPTALKLKMGELNLRAKKLEIVTNALDSIPVDSMADVLALVG